MTLLRARRIAPSAALPATLALLSLIVAAGGCDRRRAETGEPGEASPVPVSIHRVGTDPLAGGLVLPGRVGAGEEVTVAATVPGRITSLPVREGAGFAPGDPLALLDAPEMHQALEAARAAVASTELRRELALRQEARMESLHADRVASLREVELARAERRAADAADAGARAEAARLSAGARVPAPFAGVVVRRRVDEGATVLPGHPIVDIRSRNAGEILVPVPEAALPTLRTARASFQIGDGPWREARLARVEGMTDFATRTRTARFRPAAPGPALEPGAFARVRLEGGGRAAEGPEGALRPSPGSVPIVIPSAALVRRGGLRGVYVVRDGRAKLRWLRLGGEAGDRVEVLAGLDEGDSIVAHLAPLHDGAAVQIRP